MKKAAFLVLAAAVMLAGGCQDPASDGKMKLALYPGTIQVTLPPLENDQKPKSLDYKLMTTVFSEIMVTGGNVDTTRFGIFKQDVTKSLQILNEFGPSGNPDAFESLADKMSYWYNARAMWALYLSATYGKKMKAYYLNTLQEAFDRIRFPVDGKTMTLKDIDDEIYELGGYLALISAPGALSGRAAIPEAALEPKNFPGIIRDRFNEFLADRSRFEMDVLKMEIIVPRIIWQFRDKIMSDYQQLYPTPQATFLLALSSMASDIARYRFKNAIGYKCVEAPLKQNLMTTGGQKPAGFLGL